MQKEKTLERKIAYLGARNDVEIFCSHNFFENEMWLDIDSCEHEAVQMVGDAVMYLKQIERIEIHAKNKNLMRVLDDG